MIRSLPDDDVRVGRMLAAAQSITVPYQKNAPEPTMRKLTEPREATIEGVKRINPARFVEERDVLLDFNQQWHDYYGHMWPALPEQLKIIVQNARECGVDLASYSPDVMTVDDLKAIDSILERPPEQIRQMQQRIAESREIAFRYVDDVKKKSWTKTLQEIIDLQEECRHPIPKRLKTAPALIQEAWEYTHPLRFMIYCYRSDLNASKEPGGLRVPDAPKHIVKACLYITISRKHRESHGIQGVVVTIHPRAGKSALAYADSALIRCLTPSRLLAIVHNNTDIAEERHQAVRDYFDSNLSTGRRCRALFPDVTMDVKRKRGDRTFLTRCGQPATIHKEGNIAGHGVHARATGITVNDLLGDDMMDEKEAREEGTRERCNSAMTKTWMNRLTGRDSFFVFICTRWHSDDFIGCVLKLRKQGEFNFSYYNEPAGGPDDGFRPIWPEAGYDEKYLRSKFYLHGEADYSCIFQGNPDSSSTRRIPRLFFYDYKEWLDPISRSDAWKEFFDAPRTKYMLIADPSAVISKGSDRAGLLYAAFGKFRQTALDGSIEEIPRAVLLKFWSRKMTQHDIAALIADQCKPGVLPRIDSILVEAQSGFQATIEEMTRNLGVPAEKIVKKVPSGRGGGKFDSFMTYSVHVNNADLLFPGEWTKDESDGAALTCHRDWEEVADQILRVGESRHDNMLDCVKWLLDEISPDIFTMRGGDARPRKSARDWKRNEIDLRRSMYDRITRPKPKVTQPRIPAFARRSQRSTW